MVTRRGFLGMLAGAAMAPAIVKAENLMRIVVPKRELMLVMKPEYAYGRGLTPYFTHIDEAAFLTSEDGIILPEHMAESFKRFQAKVERNSFTGAHMPLSDSEYFKQCPRDVFLNRPDGLQAMPTEKATTTLARWMARTGRA